MASTTAPQPQTTAIPLITSQNSDDSIKLAIGVALLRSKLLSHSQQPPHQSPPHPPSSSSSAVRWKKKAKERKQEVLRLKEELKHLEDNLRGDLYPQSASCKCYFFSHMQNANANNFIDRMSDHNLSDFLRRRFLRQVRMQKRLKQTASNSVDRAAFAEFDGEEELEQLKLSAEFLVDLCNTPNPVKTPHFANLAHQAVDFIICSLNHVLSMGKDATLIEGIISSLIVRLVTRMCAPMEDELYCDLEIDPQVHIEHVIRQLGSIAYIGQRILLCVCHRISQQAEILLSLDPFDQSFPLIHDSMFVMIQLIEFLVSDYLVTWSKDVGFDTRLFEEWMNIFLHARKTLQSTDTRLTIYELYMDRITGELARQAGQASLLQKLSQDMLDNLFQ